jgi:hypothetical protein
MMLFLENRPLRQSGNASGFSGLSADLRSSSSVISLHLHLRYREAFGGLSIADSAFWIKLRESSPEAAGWNSRRSKRSPREKSPDFLDADRVKPLAGSGNRPEEFRRNR